MANISVTEFTRYPGPRFKKLGKGSGEEFREEFLWPKLQSDKNLKVDLDGAAGYGSSFLEEAFGGLVRVHELNEDDVSYLMSHIKSDDDPTLIDEVKEYMREALDARRS